MKLSLNNLMMICLALILSSCAATKKTDELNEWYFENQRQSVWQSSRIQSSFDKSHANYLTIQKLTKITESTPSHDLIQTFEEMSQIKTDYSTRLKLYRAKAKAVRQIWRSTDKITEGEENWNTTNEFLTYSDQELAELDTLYNNYFLVEAKFNRILNSKEFSAYNRRLPKTTKAINNVLAEYERQQEKENYTLRFNDNVIAAMTRKLETTKYQFNDLLKLADKDSLIEHQQNTFNRPKHLRRVRFEITSDTQRQLDTLLSQHINTHIVAAAQQYVKEIQSPRQASKELPLIDKKSKFKALYPYVSADNRNTVNQAFQTQRSKLFNQAIILPSQAGLTQIEQQGYQPTEQLKKRIQHHLAFTKHYKDLLDQPEIQQHLKQAQQQRIALLDQIKEQRLQMIRNAASFNELNFFYQEVVTKDDATTAPAMALKAAQKRTYQKVTEFKPTYSSTNLDVNSFNNANLALKTELTGLYLGDFSNSRLAPNTTLSSMLFSNYLKAYSNLCPQYLPQNKVPITKAVCDTERVTKNGWGQVVSRNCIKWVDVPTGMYADPKLYQASIEQSRQAGLKLIGSALLSSDVTAKFSAFRDEQTLQSDMHKLIKNNQCNTAGLQRFEDNLYRFATKQSPLTLKSGTQLANLAVFYQADLNYQNINTQHLANALVKENARTWLMNRYSDGSLQVINTTSNPEDNSLKEILAGYRYGTAFGGGYNGKVRITFADKIPKCLYFADNRGSCRAASKIITNQYERGRYNK